MNVEDKVKAILENTGAYITGHFKLVSGKHSDCYIHVRLALIFDEYKSFFAGEIAKFFHDDNINAVMGFTSGGIWLAEAVATSLNVRAIKAERKENKIVLIKGFLIQPDENILIVDDLLTTGGSIQKAINCVKEAGGKVAGVAVVVDRSPDEQTFETKFKHLVKIQMNLWQPESCPLESLIPLADLSSIETNPEPFLRSLPDEVRPIFIDSWKDMLEDLRKGKTLEEAWKIFRPVYELPGKNQERVAILASFDAWDPIAEVCKIVAKLGYYAVTSRAIYKKDTGKSIEFKHYDHEALNDFLRRMISCCQYVIIIYTTPGGQFIETSWCSEYQKHTLGLVQLKLWPFYDLERCEYLLYNSEHDLLYCNGFRAIDSRAKLVGGWICSKNERCPFPACGLTKMIPCLYMTSRTMFLVGSHRADKFKLAIENFLRNHGVLKYEDIFGKI